MSTTLLAALLCGVIGWWLGAMGLFVPVESQSASPPPPVPAVAIVSPVESAGDSATKPAPVRDSATNQDQEPDPAPEATAEVEPGQPAADPAPEATAEVEPGQPAPDPEPIKSAKTHKAKDGDKALGYGYDKLMRLGNDALRGSRLDAALAYFQRAAQQSRSVEPDYKIGVVHLKMGHVSDAIRALKRTVSRNPDYRGTYIALARALEKAGRTGEALQYYKGYLERFPNGNQASQARRAIERMN